MASRRETRSKLRENKDGGSGGFNEEMDKWRKVADMIGETVEYVCNMGQQERDELVMLLPDDDGDAIADVIEKDALLGELLESDDEGDIENLKRQRSTPTKVEEPMEHRKKSKLSYENNSDKPKRFILLSRSKKKEKAEASLKLNNASDHPSPVTVMNLDFSKYVSPTATGPKLISQSSPSESSSQLESTLPKVAGIARMTEPEFPDEVILSPIFKGRIKRACKRRPESFDAENIEVHEQRRNDAGKNIQLQLDSNGSLSEKFQESDYIVEQDEGTDDTTTVNDSPIHDMVNDNQYEKNEINDEKSGRVTNKAFETENFNESHYIVEQNATTDLESGFNESSIYEMVNDNQSEKTYENQSEKNEINYEKIGKSCNKISFLNPQKMKDDSVRGTANCAVPENIVEHNKKSIRDAVIDKIVNWNDFHNINLINQNVSSVEECFDTMEENREKSHFKNAIKNINIVEEVALGVEDIQKYFNAVKKIKGEYSIQEEPPLVAVCSGRRELGFGLKATRMKPKSSRSSGVENKSGISSRVENKSGISSGVEIKSGISSGVEIKSGSSGLAKAENYLNNRVRTRSKDQDVMTDNINIEIDDFGKKEEANDSQKSKRGRPSKLSGEKSKLPSRGETKKPRGGSKRKLLSRAELHQRFDDAPLEEGTKNLPASKQTKGKGLRGRTGRGKGVGRGKDREEKNNNVGREKIMNNDNNNPVSDASTSTKSLGGESFNNPEGESSDADEIKIIGVIPSPASTSSSDGRKESNHEQIFVHPPVHPESSRQGDKSVGVKTASGDSLSAIHVKKEATGECPMCRGEFWMKELQKHAAWCDGGGS